MADAKKGKEFFEQALIAAKENMAMCYPLLCSSALVDPFASQTWLELGAAANRSKLLRGAIAAYRMGLVADPNNHHLMVNLGNQLYHDGRLEEAERLTREAIKINPNSAEAWTNLSMICLADKDNEAAIKTGRKALELNDQPLMRLGLAFALLNDGQYSEGLRLMEARFKDTLVNFGQYPYPQWNGEDGTGKTLFLVAEQGMGDAISFMRFVPEVLFRFGKVIMGVHGPLMRLFESFNYDPNVEVIPLPCPLPAADFWSTFSSLPTALGLEDHDIAQRQQVTVTAPPLAAPWKSKDHTFHVGLAWAGDPTNGIDRWRSVAFTDMLQLAGLDRSIQLYGLQVGPRSADIHANGAAPIVRDVAQYIRDVVDTLSIFDHLDLVICVESSIRHMAALARKEAWVLVPRWGCDWRLSYGTRGPIWADNHVLWRQKEGESWEQVIHRIGHRLKKRARGFVDAGQD